MAQIQSPISFGGAAGASAAGGSLQTAESYLLGTANVGTSDASTQIENGSPANLFSQNPTIMASSWDLPANVGALRLNTGNSTTAPVSSQTRTKVSDGITMLNLYDKLDSGTPLTNAEVSAATKLGGPVARAAQLVGTSKPKKAPKGLSGAVTDAKNELAQRLYSTVGIGPEDLGKAGMNSPVPKGFAATMQNAGYGVTKAMTVKQALTAAQSVAAGSPPPTTAKSNVTVSQYIQGLQSMSKSQLTQLQQSLYTGGFYDDTYYGGTDSTTGASPKEYTQGVLDTGTILAFRQAILQTLVDQQSGKSVTLDGVITGGASTNPALGNVPVTSGTSSDDISKTASVPLATEAQTQAPLINAFVAALGRNPSQAELAAFTNAYQGQLEAGSKTLTEAGENPSGVVDYSSGIPFVQGTPTVSAAATNFAQDQDSTEYQAHNVANAFGLLMNLVDRSGTSSLDTPGTRPTTTT